MNLLKKLKQRNSALYASLFAVICVGTPHIVPVVAQFSQFKSQWAAIPHALMYALALEVGIVFFALRSKMIQTIIFAIIATSLYLGYYDSYIPWWTITPFMPIDISISLPVMIVLIAHETSKKRNRTFAESIQKIGRIEDISEIPRPNDPNNVHTVLLKQNGTEQRPKNPKPIPEEIRQEILKLITEGKNYREIAKMMNTSISTISRVKNEQTEQDETSIETEKSGSAEDAVKQAIESGKHIEGAHLEDGKASILIK